jgi:5-methylcytosine-specific restriction endonuclease McrA
MRPCLDCDGWADPASRSGSRCTTCERRRNTRRNATPTRQAYKDPAYRAIPLGTHCQQCRTTYDLTRDHVIPLSRGGTNHPSNIRTLCRSCNAAKGNQEA